MSIREWFKEIETYQYKSRQLVLADDILDKFWAWEITGYGGDNLIDYKKMYLRNMLCHFDLPNDATALDVGMSEVVRAMYPETRVEKIIGFAELEAHARKLAGDLGLPRYIHYGLDGGNLHKYTYNHLSGERSEITMSGLYRTNLE